MHTAVTLALVRLLHADLFALSVRDDLRFDRCAFHKREADRQCISIGKKQDFFKYDLLSTLHIVKRNFKSISFLHFFLEAGDIDNCEHLS